MYAGWIGHAEAARSISRRASAVSWDASAVFARDHAAGATAAAATVAIPVADCARMTDAMLQSAAISRSALRMVRVMVHECAPIGVLPHRSVTGRDGGLRIVHWLGRIDQRAGMVGHDCIRG